MALTPRLTLDEEFINEMKCAICENTTLKVVHVEKYPDFVACDHCGSAFVVENDGSWVMYGKIPEEFPETKKFALKQWAWLDAVSERAADEREAKRPASVVNESDTPFEEVAPAQPVATELPSPIEDIVPPEPVGSTSVPSTEKDSPLDPTTSELTPLAEELAPPEQDVSPPPFHEERPTPSMDDLFPEETYPPSTDSPEGGTPTPPFPEDVIILGDGDSEISESLEGTPSFMEPDPDPEDVIVSPAPEPVAALDNSWIEEDEIASDEGGELDFDMAIEDITEQVIEDQPEIFTPPQQEIQQKETPEAAPVTTSASLEGREPSDSPQVQTGNASSIPVGEPEPGKRYRVTIKGSQPKYPKNYCAHCLRTPVKLKTIMRSSLPDPKRPGSRKMVSLDLPFCKDCQTRMDARTQDESFARILAFSVAIVVGLIAIVTPLLLGWVDFQANAFLSFIVLMVFAILGFSVPLLILLSRAGNYPPPRDAALVLSTLLVFESGSDLTQFEWRNQGYAELFRQVNNQNVHGGLEQIADRTSFTEVPPKETVQDAPEQPTAELAKPVSEKQPPAEPATPVSEEQPPQENPTP